MRTFSFWYFAHLQSGNNRAKITDGNDDHVANGNDHERSDSEEEFASDNWICGENLLPSFVLYCHRLLQPAAEAAYLRDYSHYPSSLTSTACLVKGPFIATQLNSTSS